MEKIHIEKIYTKIIVEKRGYTEIIKGILKKNQVNAYNQGTRF
jgi:hypothetical protein